MCPPVMGGVLSSLWRVMGGQNRDAPVPTAAHRCPGAAPLGQGDSKPTTAAEDSSKQKVTQSHRNVTYRAAVGARKKIVLPRYYYRGETTASDSSGSSGTSSGPCSPVFARHRRGVTAEGRKWTHGNTNNSSNSTNNSNSMSSSPSQQQTWGVGAAEVMAGKGLAGSRSDCSDSVRSRSVNQCAPSSLGATSGPSRSPPLPPSQGRFMDTEPQTKDVVIRDGSNRMANQGSMTSYPPKPPPLPAGAAHTVTPSADTKSGDSSTLGYLEDIRAFDIYTINRRPSDAPYPPTLPALASQTTDDDDTDSDDSTPLGSSRRSRGSIGCGCGLGNSSSRCVVCDNEAVVGKKKFVPRKRKNVDASEVALRKRWRDKNSCDKCSEDILCSTTHRPNIPRPGPSNDFIPAHTLETNMFISPITGYKILPTQTPHHNKFVGGRSVVCDVDDDAPSSDDTLSDDDDDDETSTVVPDDFETDGGTTDSDRATDSDIEVLQEQESWVDLSTSTDPLMASTSAPKTPTSPDRVAPLPFGNGEEYLRLLREAQKESNHSSARVSLASSRKETPRDSPKSPPNSPNTEMATENTEEAILRGVYINYYNKEGDFIRVEKNTETDWIWDWSSRPDQTPPKEWPRFSHPRAGKGVNRGASIRRVMVGSSSLFSRDVLYTLLITNVLSLILGTGIGMWLSKRSGGGSLSTLPIN